MTGLDVEWVAEVAGVEPAYVARLAELGILDPSAADGYGPGDARRAALVRMLEVGGLPLNGIAAAVRRDKLSLAFVDLPSYERFASFQTATFDQTSTATGVSIELLLCI